MSLLNCPVCQAAMREVKKGGVLIDTCTQCRGVWLDRGELEKLIGMMDRDEPERSADRDRDNDRDRDRDRDRNSPGNRDENRGRLQTSFDDDDDDDRRQRDGRQPPSCMSRLFDFFD